MTMMCKRNNPCSTVRSELQTDDEEGDATMNLKKDHALRVVAPRIIIESGFSCQQLKKLKQAIGKNRTENRL